MVNGQLKGKVIVVDLDGTLLKGNSLRIYINCGMRESLRKLRIMEFMRIAFAAGLRGLRIISHRNMKKRVLCCISPTSGLKKRFVDEIRRDMRESVKQYMTKTEKMGAKVLLATAAADSYVSWFWEKDLLATDTAKFLNDGADECRGQNKLKGVQDYCQSQGLSIFSVLTDHLDDLPLLTQYPTAKKILVNPDTSTLMAAKMAGIDFETMK